MNFDRVLVLNGASTFPLISNHGKGTQEPSDSVCKTIFKKPLLGLGNGTNWSQISQSLVELPLWAQVPAMSWFMGSMPQPRVNQAEGENGVAT